MSLTEKARSITAERCVRDGNLLVVASPPRLLLLLLRANSTPDQGKGASSLASSSPDLGPGSQKSSAPHRDGQRGQQRQQRDGGGVAS